MLKLVDDRDKYHLKKIQLLHYLNIYISKKFNMNDIFVSIKERVKQNLLISDKQFNSILKYIENEKPFRGKGQDYIRNYFVDFVNFKHKKNTRNRNDTNTNTLNQFL